MLKYLIGIDEVGRGPVAGPVTLCAVCVKLSGRGKVMRSFCGIKDCKGLTRLQREKWLKEIKKMAESGRLEYAISSVAPFVVDRKGIAGSVRLGVKRVLQKLDKNPLSCRVLLDGSLKAPSKYIFQKTIIKGDEKERIISIASVIAKVWRDRKMIRLANKFPNYGFEEHAGYGTGAHMRAIRKLGMSPIHRRSFLTNLKLKTEAKKG